MTKNVLPALFLFINTMEIETILSTLTEKMGDTQLSDRTLTAYIEAHPVAEGTDPDEAYFTTATTFLKSLEGQYNHDVAEGIKKGGTPPPPNPKNLPGGGADPERQKLLDRIDALEKAQKERTDAETQTALAAKVKAEMKKSNATDTYVLEQTFKGITLDTKKSVADLTTEMLAKYDAEYKACRGEGAAPRQTTGGSGGTTETRSDRFFAKVKKREGWPQKK